MDFLQLIYLVRYLQMGKMIIQFLFNHLKKKYNDEIGDYNHHFIFYFMPVHHIYYRDHRLFLILFQ